jgi:rare lipoprotein A
MLSNLRIDVRIAHAAICFCLAASLAACAAQTEPRPEAMALPVGPSTTPPPLPAPPPPLAATPKARRAKPSGTVTASFQGSDSAGQPTASGELYDPDDLTAASRNLPIGSTIKVTNPATGRSVNVRINDRGPFVHGRSLDLSESAAEKIGMTHKGVTRVKITKVSLHPVSSEPESSPTAGATALP